jgi:nitrite reductase/ring-hydroxylating ferredoxin subunit
MRPGPIAICPANWYLLAFSRDLKKGAVIASRLAGREIVLFRGEKTGAATAFDSHCAHMGCHLKHGVVSGDALQCALHHRLITPSGLFVKSDGSAYSGLRQRRYPVREQHGGIFVFVGSEAGSAFPSPEISGLGDIAVAPMRSRTLPLPWWTFIANGMDVEHLQAVHDRRLLEPPVFNALNANSVQVSYRSMPTGKSLGDRVMTWLAKDGVHGRITCIGGTMMLVESKAGTNRAFILLSMVPDDEGTTTLRGLVGVPSQGGKLAGALRARLSAWLFHAFLSKDIGVLDAMKLHAPYLENTQGDGFTRQLFAFLRDLPNAGLDASATQPAALQLVEKAS